MRLFLILFLISIYSNLILSQDDSKISAGVELPDFVITGKEVVRIKKSDKLTPFLIGTFSEKFVLPTYSPEEIQVKEISLPIKDDLNLLSGGKFYKGYISGGIGLFALPDLSMLYAIPMSNAIFRTKINGAYNRSHLENSDNYKLQGNVDLIYWTDVSSTFLPGTQFNLNSDLSTKGYKFYGSDISTQKRTLNNFKLTGSIKNEYNSSFLFKIVANNNYTSLINEKFTENTLDLSLSSLVRFSILNLGVHGKFKKVWLSDELPSRSQKNYVLVRPSAGFQFTTLLKSAFGFTFSQSGEEKFLMPYGEIAIKLAPNFTLLGEFNPTAEFHSPADFIIQNPYFLANNSQNLFIKKQLNYQVAVKYEYKNNLEINGGFRYFSSDSLPYFYENQKGKFLLKFSDIKRLSPFIEFNLFNSTFGHFFSSLEFNAATNDTGQTFPYIPFYNLSAHYGYTFMEVLTTSLSFIYKGKFYTNLENSKQIDNYIDLSLSLAYKFDERFEFFVNFSNFINNKNFIWNNYQEKPFDILLGVKYNL